MSYRRTVSMDGGQLGGDAREHGRRVRDDEGGRGGLGPVRHEPAPAVLVEQDAVPVGPDVRERRAGVIDASRDRSLAAGPEPQQRRDVVEREPEVDVVGVEVAKLQEGDVLLEALGHRELVGELVVAGDRLAVRRPARDRRGHPGSRDVLEDAERLPLSVARPEPPVPELRRLVSGHLVVRDHDRLPPSAVLPVQPRDGVRGRTRPGEEVEDDGVRLVLDEEPKRVLDRVERLRERETAARAACGRSMPVPSDAGVVSSVDSPYGSRCGLSGP